MLRKCNAPVFAVLSLTLGGLAAPVDAADIPGYITAAVQSPARPPVQMARDTDRKPAEVVAFSGIKPGHKVADLLPSDGYFTRILSKAVGANGKVYAFVPQRGFRYPQDRRAEEQKQRGEGKNVPLSALDAVLQLHHTTDFGNVMAINCSLTDFGGNFALPEQLDAVFTSRGYHELHNKVAGPVNNAPVDMVAVNKAIFRALKPGGIYLVADYAASKGAGFGQTQTLNRAEADAVKAEVLAAGFAFDGESKVLANASDDHTKPATDPSLLDKSDQFILRFSKPANSSASTKRLLPSVYKNWEGNTFVLGPPDQRGVVLFQHMDGTAQEFSGNEMELGFTYFDADGHDCMYHEHVFSMENELFVSAGQEGYVVCHAFTEGKLKAKAGDVWTEGGKSQRSLIKGYQYPNLKKQP